MLSMGKRKTFGGFILNIFYIPLRFKCFILISMALVGIESWVLCTYLVSAALQAIWFERNQNIVDDASENVEGLWDKILTFVTRINLFVEQIFIRSLYS